MREPNFSESQLQQAANTAFIRRVAEHRREWLYAVVPSLLAEYELGWDSAFFLDWLDIAPPPHPANEGCNFFVQYKLSGQLTSPGAKEWMHWGEAYFRFKIPHSTTDSSGTFIDDYHQWDRLKDLANAGYPTYYATNATLNKDDLKSALQSGNLLDSIPLLDVRTVGGQHKHVTFKPKSPNFKLHSELEEVEQQSFSEAIKNIENTGPMTLEEGNKVLLNALNKLRNSDDLVWKEDLQQIERPAQDASPPKQPSPFLVRARLMTFFRRHMDTNLLWVPIAQAR